MASAPPANVSRAVSRSLVAGAAFTAHTPGIALSTSSQCVPGSAAAALAALKGPRTKHFFYTIFTHATNATPAGSKCDAATARNATTEVFPRAYTCVPLATAFNDDNTQTSEQDSTLPNRGGSYVVDCVAARVLRSTTYATPDCSGAPVSTLTFPADDKCTLLNHSLNGVPVKSNVYTSYIQGYCVGGAKTTPTASQSPLRLRWNPVAYGFSSAAPHAAAVSAAAAAAAALLATAALLSGA